MSGEMRAGDGARHVFLRNMVLMAAIGVHPHEHGSRQRVRVNVDLLVEEEGDVAERLSRVLDYQVVAERVRGIVGAGHIRLVETLAERVAAACLEDGRVLRARVRVEKLDVFADMESAGVEVERGRKVPGR